MISGRKQWAHAASFQITLTVISWACLYAGNDGGKSKKDVEFRVQFVDCVYALKEGGSRSDENIALQAASFIKMCRVACLEFVRLHSL